MLRDKPSVPVLPGTVVELSYISPSITNNGWFCLLSDVELPPRIVIDAPAPAEPLNCVMFTPGTLPAKELMTLVFLFFINSCALKSVTEYPNAFRAFLIPNAVTTTSLMLSPEDFMVTAKSELLVTFNSCGS